MKFEKTRYRLVNVADGHEFEDKGWTMSDPDGKTPSLVRAVYDNRKFTPRDDLDGIYRYAEWMPISRILRKSCAPVTYKAMEGFAGVGYVPVAMVAQQVVAGMNYRFLCEATTVLPGAETDYALVTVYKDLNGNAEITEIVRMDETETDG